MLKSVMAAMLSNRSPCCAKPVVANYGTVNESAQRSEQSSRAHDKEREQEHDEVGAGDDEADRDELLIPRATAASEADIIRQHTVQACTASNSEQISQRRAHKNLPKPPENHTNFTRASIQHRKQEFKLIWHSGSSVARSPGMMQCGMAKASEMMNTSVRESCGFS